jgi:two-component system chemotaxis response regulator CheY
MMAKKPEDRFADMTAVIAAFQALTLPAEAPTARPGPAPAVAAGTLPTDRTMDLSAPPAPVGLKVLLAEPSRTQAVIIRGQLKNLGATTVATVASGAEALAEARRSSPDVVLATMHLSDMTGPELARQLAGAGGLAPGFVLIATRDEGHAAGSLSQAGPGPVLTKPFGLEQLKQALELATRRASPPADRARLRVLVVDDSAAARSNVRRALSNLGFALFTEAADGAQAVALTARETFDLIVTDYNMPHMDGKGLVGYLRQAPATAAVPILLVTTEKDQAKLDAVRQLGVTAVCDKSFSVEAVRPIVGQLFG